MRETVLGHEEKVYEPLDARTTPKPLAAALATATPDAKLPASSAPALLPPILVGGRRLDGRTGLRRAGGAAADAAR